MSMQAHGLSLHLGNRLLVADLDWQVQPGECWCVIGRNGAGKSTLLRTLAGLRDIGQGAVLLDGRNLSEWNLLELARRRAYLPQSRSDAFGYRAIDTVLAARHPYQDNRYWDADADYRSAHAALQALDVDSLAQRDIRTLSGGERQRVAIAAVLAQDTPLLILDEPAGALDLAHQIGVMKLLSDLCRAQDRTVVMVSHDLNMAHAASTHALLLMGDGRWHAGAVDAVMQEGKLSECLGYPIEALRHGSRTLYIPARDDFHR